MTGFKSKGVSLTRAKWRGLSFFVAAFAVCAASFAITDEVECVADCRMVIDNDFFSADAGDFE
jgi:hypothetical protein